jgi:hypothetical protein|tara:strand:- start:5704 stop:5922 length:219 start_codon:yes stop_codon:yes gene_type:complete
VSHRIPSAPPFYYASYVEWWILEYKGADRLGSLDTSYKENLGAIWAKICGESYNFRLVGKENLAEILEEMAN